VFIALSLRKVSLAEGHFFGTTVNGYFILYRYDLGRRERGGGVHDVLPGRAAVQGLRAHGHAGVLRAHVADLGRAGRVGRDLERAGPAQALAAQRPESHHRPHHGPRQVRESKQTEK